MDVRAVLFDMDGVLVKSLDVWARLVALSGERFRGRPVTREEFLPTFGQGTTADVEVFGLSCTPAELDAFYAEEFPRHLDAVWVNPDARPLLETLAARGLRRGLVTNTVAPLAQDILRHAGLLAHLDAFGTADRVAQAKPAPDLVLLVLAELGVSPAHAVMVGDSRYDALAAKAAGVAFIGLGVDGGQRVERLADVLALVQPGTMRQS